MSVVIKTKLNTINTKLDDIDAAVKSGKKKIADALIFNDVTEATPNASNPNAYMTFTRYAELITSIKTRTSPMKLVFNINSSVISSSAKSTNYKRTIILPVTGISGFSVNGVAREVIDADTNDYTNRNTLNLNKGLLKGGNVNLSLENETVATESLQSPEDYLITDAYGNECVDGLYVPSWDDIETYLDEEQQEELLEAMDELDITPIGLKKGLKGGSVGLMSAVGGSGVATASNPDAVYNYIVDWGDGSSNQYNDGDTYANNKDAIFHTYENEGIYQVQITGNFRRLYANAESESNWIIDTVTQTDKDGVALGSNRNLSMMYYLTEIRNFGNTLLNNCAYGFCRCTKLTTLPSDLSTNAFADVTSFDHVFYGCTSLASLPYDEVFEVGLFSNCTKCTSFANAFRGCTGLTGNIPLKLMDGCPACTTVANLFNGCTHLRGALIDGVESIPAGLIAGMTGLTTASGMFSGCASLAGCSITGSKLFRDSPNLTDISELFRNLAVVGTLERDFFPIVTDEQGTEIAGSNKITGLRQAFWHSGITAIDYDAFIHLGSNGINMRDCFNACPITAIPTGLLEGLTGYNLNLERAFEDCTAITSVAATSLANLKVANARGMFGGCTGITSALPNANSDWSSYQYIKKWYGIFAGCNNMSDVATIPLELGGNGNRSFSQGKVGAIALSDGTTVDPKDYVYNSNNEPVGVVYADMYISGLNAKRANGAGNVNDDGTGIHKIYATVLNDTTKGWISAQNYAVDVSTITNTSSTSVAYGNYTYSADGTTQTLNATRYDGEAYFDALRKWVFASGYYLDALPVGGEFVFATAKDIYTTYEIISSTADVTTLNAVATRIYFLMGEDEFTYNAYTWNTSTTELERNSSYDANLKTMSSTRYPAMQQVNQYSSNGADHTGKCFLPDAADLWDQFVMRHLIKKAIDKIVDSATKYTTSNAYPMRDGTYYWASAEYSQNGAWYCSTFIARVDYGNGKWSSSYVRPSLALPAA